MLRKFDHLFTCYGEKMHLKVLTKFSQLAMGRTVQPLVVVLSHIWHPLNAVLIAVLT